MERDHGPRAEGAASFHTTRRTTVMRAAQSQAREGQSALAELCQLYGIHSTFSLGAIGCQSGTPRCCARRSAARCQIRQRLTRKSMRFVRL